MTTTDGAERVELRPGAYHDSVALLQVSRRLAGLDGVLAAQVAMATDLNVEVISGMGFTVPQSARPNDLVVAVRASSGQALDGALAALDQALAAPSAGSGASSGGAAGAPAPPRTRVAWVSA